MCSWTEHTSFSSFKSDFTTVFSPVQIQVYKEQVQKEQEKEEAKKRERLAELRKEMEVQAEHDKERQVS